DGVTREAPGLVFERRLDNPPEFPDIDVESGLKALLFKQGAILPEKTEPSVS
ncbi:class I SAM-dependent methyltransferase, partial [Brevundimonas sp. P7753]|nr:class I SAM-dependent methyltransferase [Brevundimonas sp. P7753]